MLRRIAVAQLLGMTLWFSATAAAPAIVAEFSLSGSGAAWLTMAVQAGLRTVLAVSSVLALGGALVIATVRDGPHVSASAPFDPRAIAKVVRNRGFRLATLGYLGHMWELYAMWGWFAGFSAAWLSNETGAAREASLLTFVAIASGAVGCVAAGQWGDAWGKAAVAGWAMVVSGCCAALTPLLFGGPGWVLAALAIVWGFSIVADSAQFSALVSDFSPGTHVGTALTLQTSAGFLLTMISLRMIPLLAGAVGWRWAFVALAPGPALGALAMWRLSPRRVSREM